MSLSSRTQRPQMLDRYRSLINDDLPRAAKAKSDRQPIWPVHLNHCFGRIILDNICKQPWRRIIPAPAIRNMSPDQLEQAVTLAEDILSGKTDLATLNRESLRMRGEPSQSSASGLILSKTKARKLDQILVTEQEKPGEDDRKRSRTIDHYFKAERKA